MEASVKSLKVGLSVAVSSLATEHFFTAFLSSPKASKQFLNSDDVREMFFLASVVSLGFSVVMSFILKNPYGLLSCLVFVGVFYYAYREAM
jgi:hypothetical protein